MSNFAGYLQDKGGNKLYPKAIDEYLTEETPIGTWIDGKTIYRKVAIVQAPKDKEARVIYDATDDNIDTLISFGGCINQPNGDVVNIGYYWNSTNYSDIYYNKNAKAITMQLNSDMYYLDPCILILEYTKKN